MPKIAKSISFYSKIYYNIRMNNFPNPWDPYKQGPWYFKWGTWSLLFVLGMWAFLCAHWNSEGVELVYGYRNMLLYTPNYLIHEMLGHNTIGRLGFMLCYNSCPGLGNWWIAAMGNGVETAVPLGLLIISLRMSGGRYLLPILWLWLGDTLYEAGIYCSDARAMKLPLTSSDMISSFKPGEVLGDWHHILEPLGLLNYDIIIGRMLVFIGLLCLVIALYSVYYYWTHMDDYLYGNRYNQYTEH